MCRGERTRSVVGPLVLAIPAAAGAVAIVAFAIKRARDLQKLGGNRVAILGDHKVGKSTLLTTLARPTRNKAISALADTGGGVFTLEVGDTMVTFDVPVDLPAANPVTSVEWKNAIEQADHVWYLFRADRVAQRDKRELATIAAHVHFIAKWQSKTHPAKVMLIGTWADADSGWAEERPTFIQRVSDVDTIKLARVQMGNAPLAIGSLAGEASSRDLEREIRKKLK
jgi:hypothetical protein